MISAQRYADAVRPVLDRLVDTQAEAVDRAADVIARGLRAGGGQSAASRRVLWPSTARAVRWKAAWARSWVRCATAM